LGRATQISRIAEREEEGEGKKKKIGCHLPPHLKALAATNSM